MRILNQAFRLYVEPDRLESTIAFYEAIQGKTCERRISIAETGIEVAVIGGFILLAGSEQALKPIRDAQAVLMVDSLDGLVPWLQVKGATILHEPREAIGGRNLLVRHPDGLVAEYYEAAKVAP
ncbi:glyoxalase [Paraburkholderia sediminicola]|uniref:glyoxalase n=1 Tax=Paraburkholderia sp. D1E TaxID=3461398 RepID=UPI000EB30709